LFLSAVLLLPATAAAALLDFEGLTVNTVLSTEFQHSDSVVFLQSARVHLLGANHATSGSLGLFDAGAAISAEFRLPDGTPGVTDEVSVKGDLVPIAGNVFLEAYDFAGTLIDTDIEPDSPAPAMLSLSLPGIHRIVFYSQSGTVAFDDLAFNTPVPLAAVPEPAPALLVFSAGLGLLALKLRRLL
jgi:hypothetical protein